MHYTLLEFLSGIGITAIATRIITARNIYRKVRQRNARNARYVVDPGKQPLPWKYDREDQDNGN